MAASPASGWDGLCIGIDHLVSSFKDELVGVPVTCIRHGCGR